MAGKKIDTGHQAVLTRALTIVIASLHPHDPERQRQEWDKVTEEAVWQLEARKRSVKEIASFRKRSCSQKLKFDTRQDAESYLQWRQDRGEAPDSGSAYSCVWCPGYHLTYGLAVPKCRCSMCPVHVTKETSHG